MTSVLDLPIERQKEIATSRGMTLAEWQKESKESIQRCDDFISDESRPILQRTPEEEAHWRRKVDSGNPV